MGSSQLLPFDLLVVPYPPPLEDMMESIPNTHLPDPRVVGREYAKTATIHAVQMSAPFYVDTLEGRHNGKAGDWLVRANTDKGEMWVIDNEVFQRTYKRCD